MHLALLTLGFKLVGCHSLKEKRQRLSGLKHRFGKIPNVAVSETEHHDLHQVSQWQFVVIGQQRKQIEQLLSSIELHAQSQLDAEITDCSREWI